MPPPDESVSTYETILLNSFEQDDMNIAVNGDRDELNTGETYFADEEGRIYYRRDLQKDVPLLTEQELQKYREETQILVKGDGYQTATDTLMPSESGGNEISYVLIMQDETNPLMNVGVEVDNMEKDVSNVYILQEKEAESIDKGTDNIEENPKYTLDSNDNTQIQTDFTCNFCPYKNKKRYLLLRHLKTHCTERPYQCTVCDRGFKNIVSLQNHMNMHNGVKPHVCKQCKSSFTTSGELVRHMRYRHTHEKPHKCPECEYASVELSKLKRHVRSHTGERPYQCSHCSYASQDSFKLKRHIRVHTGEKPYKCDFCRASFTQSNSLKLHKLIHSETQKPVFFQCKLCPTKCGRKKDLRSHMRKIHASEKPLQSKRRTCKIHNKTQQNLQTHLSKHTNEKQYICDQCSETFADKGNLIRHIAIHGSDPCQEERDLNLSTETDIRFFGENINTDESTETVEIIQLNLETDQLQGGELLTVADDNGQQYLLLEVIDAENCSDQQINISPDEFLNKKSVVQQENKEEKSETSELNNVNKTAENNIDICFGFDKDYEPGEIDGLSSNNDIVLDLI